MKYLKSFILSLFIIIFSVNFISCSSLSNKNKVKKLQFDDSYTLDLSNTEIIWEADTSLFGKEMKIYKKANDKDDIIKYYRNNFRDGNNNKVSIYKKTDNIIELRLKIDNSTEYQNLPDTRMIETTMKHITNMVKDTSRFKLRSVVKQNTKYNKTNTFSYSQTIDGYDTFGSTIFFSFLDDDWLKITISYSDLGESFSVKTISLDKVEELISLGDFNFDIDDKVESAVRKIVVEEADIIYFDRVDKKNQKHIQPCYRLKGELYTNSRSLKFTIYIRAIPEEYTYN